MDLNKFKGIAKHQHLNSNHNTGQPKTQNAKDSFLFSLKKTTSTPQANDTNQKTKEWLASYGKKTLQSDIFHISFNYSQRNAKNERENPDKMCQFLKQKQRHKNPLCIYWECQAMYSTSHLKLHNTN